MNKHMSLNFYTRKIYVHNVHYIRLPSVFADNEQYAISKSHL